MDKTPRMLVGDVVILFNALLTFVFAVVFTAVFLYHLVSPGEEHWALEFLKTFGAWYVFIVQVELLNRRRESDADRSHQIL